MTRRRRPSIVWISLFGWLGAVADAAWSDPASSDSAALLAKYSCEVADRLRRIHLTPDPADEQNRFLILSRSDFPGRYVQCVFTDLDRKIICEAASGFFLDEPRSMYLSPKQIAGLHRLGFSGDGSKDNFKLTLDVGAPPDVERIADLMLTAQAVGFDTTARDTLTFEAPDAPDEDEQGCAPTI